VMLTSTAHFRPALARVDGDTFMAMMNIAYSFTLPGLLDAAGSPDTARMLAVTTPESVDPAPLSGQLRSIGCGNAHPPAPVSQPFTLQL